MNVLTVTLGSLVDQALEDLRNYDELGRLVVRNEALDLVATTCTFVDASNLNVADVVEFGTELVRVIAKTADVTPLFTIARGVYGTTPQTHPASQVGTQRPKWNRKKVASAIVRSFPRIEARGVCVRKTVVASPVLEIVPAGVTATRYTLQVPAEARGVVRVRDGLYEADGWEFLDDRNTVDYPTGKIVRLGRCVKDVPHEIVYLAPFRWSTYPVAPGEAATIVVPEGAEALPVDWAVPFLLSNREISRSEIDRVTKWQEGEPQRGGISAGMVRARWQQFYAAIDEVLRLDPKPARRPVVRRPRAWR